MSGGWYSEGGTSVMSEQVQAIIEAVRRLTAEEQRELLEALGAVETTPSPSSSASRRDLIESIKGKYRDVATSSESFLQRKREDLVLESQS